MCTTFTADDVEKPVVNGAGEEVGVVASVDGDIAHVRPSVDAVNSITSSIGWEAVVDESRPLDTGAVREISDEVVRLEDDLPTAGDEKSTEAATPIDDDPEIEPAGSSATLDETASTGTLTTEDAGQTELEGSLEKQRLDSEDDDGDTGEST